MRAACANPTMRRFIKVHPSNLWRGELEYFHGGACVEVRLSDQQVGALPAHATLVHPDTPFSPLPWLELSDIGITVRGSSGIELAVVGKTVITAGSGRYEDAGISRPERIAA